MTPRRYFASTLTIDRRPAEHAENMQDEITALRNGLRQAKAEIEDWKRQNAELEELFKQRDEQLASFREMEWIR